MRQLTTRRPGDPSQQEPPEVPVPLEDHEITDILNGTLHQHTRTRILAESGLGKSTLFIHAEHVIASRPDDRIPLRVGAGPKENTQDDLGGWTRLPLLSAFDWQSKRDTLLADLATQLLGEVIKDEAERSAWIHEAVARHDVVFLLDSLDQTEGRLQLATFFNKDGARDCPVLLSARPTTRRAQSADYAGITWHTLWVDPFDEERIRQFWETALLLDRLLKTNEWKPLREVPVLLQQMKRLARAGLLQDLRNREAVYHRTLQMLVKHGHRRMEDAGHSEVRA